ncbi:MAG: hypothetical protein ACK46Q_11240 [Hyphomonas sp.]
MKTIHCAIMRRTLTDGGLAGARRMEPGFRLQRGQSPDWGLRARC